MTWACNDCEEEYPASAEPWVGRDDVERCQPCDMRKQGCSEASVTRVLERQMYGPDMMDGFDREAEAHAYNWGL